MIILLRNSAFDTLQIQQIMGATIQFLQGEMPITYPKVVADNNKKVGNLLNMFVGASHVREESDTMDPPVARRGRPASHSGGTKNLEWILNVTKGRLKRSC